MLSLLSPLFISQQMRKLTRKVVEVQCFRLFGELVFRVFVSKSDWSSDGLGKDSNKEKQVQDHLQIYKNRVN